MLRPGATCLCNLLPTVPLCTSSIGPLLLLYAVHQLPAIPASLAKLCCCSPAAALCTTRNLRILAAGGDGTVTWILKTVRELGLDPAPAVAIMPLGTGNDLSLSFGWGNLFLERWIAASQASRRGEEGGSDRQCG